MTIIIITHLGFFESPKDADIVKQMCQVNEYLLLLIVKVAF